MKDKIKSYSFWTALSASIILLVNSIGNLFGFKIEETLISNIVMSVCGVLVVLGVVNSPKNKEQKIEKQTQTIEENLKNIEGKTEQENEKDCH